jgi:hypothetical protein
VEILKRCLSISLQGSSKPTQGQSGSVHWYQSHCNLSALLNKSKSRTPKPPKISGLWTFFQETSIHIICPLPKEASANFVQLFQGPFLRWEQSQEVGWNGGQRRVHKLQPFQVGDPYDGQLPIWQHRTANPYPMSMTYEDADKTTAVVSLLRPDSGAMLFFHSLRSTKNFMILMHASPRHR